MTYVCIKTFGSLCIKASPIWSKHNSSNLWIQEDKGKDDETRLEDQCQFLPTYFVFLNQEIQALVHLPSQQGNLINSNKNVF